MNRILEDHLDEMVVLCQNYNIKSLYAVGEICDKEFDDHNEIGLLIDFNSLPEEQFINKMYQMTFLFEKVLQHKIELVTVESLSPYLGPHILKEVEYAAIAA